MIAIKIKLNQTIVKMFQPRKWICLPHLLAVINDVWYSNSFLALEVWGMANSSEPFSGCCASVGLCALGALGMGNSGDSPNAWIDMAPCTSYNRITSSFHNTHAAPASLVLLEPRWGRGKKEFLARMWKSSSEPLYYSFGVTRWFYFHHKATFPLINQLLTYSDRNFLMPEAWCSSFCEAQSYRLS